MDGGPAEFEGFEWDEAKSDATFAQRGLDFEAAAGVFDSDYLERENTSRAYGERRYVAIGELEGMVIAVVWTPRGLRRRIISARPASNRERREYREHREAFERRDP